MTDVNASTTNSCAFTTTHVSRIPCSASPKEKWIALLTQQPTDGIPIMFQEVKVAGCTGETFENGPIGGGIDGFGNGWIPTDSAGGQVALDPTIIPLDDVCNWEDIVTFPNLDAFDWAGLAERQTANVNREIDFLDYHSWNSVFLRFTHLLGFENALCAFYEEPEASRALINAIADYKIGIVERVAKYFKPDGFTHYDDVATGRSLFMNPEVYREFIKPAHTRINEACIGLDIIPQTHVCGYCTDIIPDLIDEKSAAWQSAQPANDIAHIIETYGDRITVIGGYDTNGAPATTSATDEEIVAEVTRCADTYGKYGHSYAFMGFFIGAPGDARKDECTALMYKTINQLKHKYF